MQKYNATINRKFTLGTINPYVYGSFVEHMGRVVYSGIYEPTHPLSDEDGFRTDIIEKVKELGVTCIRYPGGNFVSNYNWKDGVGPKELRPKKRELAWKSIETNEFGTDEFMKWIKKVNATPIFAVNFGTRGIENATSLLEYCNMPTGTDYSDYRANNGHAEPYRVPIWCLGNEMDGPWQLGHKTAEDYAKLVAQTAYAMKSLDPSIELVACGSSSSTMPTYIDWERTVLEYAYDYIDYISLHQYYGGQELGTAEFLAQSVDFEQYVKSVISLCDVIKSKKHSQKTINISVDEWGVWEIPGEDVADSVASRDWEVAPTFSEQIYTMEDTLLFASMLMVMVRNGDRVKAACQSLLTNISATIMTKRDGESWVQPIFYPFSFMSKYAKGDILNIVADSSCYFSTRYGMIPELDVLATHNDNEITIFTVNRTDHPVELNIDLENFNKLHFVEVVTLQDEDLKATNEVIHDRITPHSVKLDEVVDQHFHYTSSAYTWTMYRLIIE